MEGIACNRRQGRATLLGLADSVLGRQMPSGNLTILGATGFKTQNDGRQCIPSSTATFRSIGNHPSFTFIKVASEARAPIRGSRVRSQTLSQTTGPLLAHAWLEIDKVGGRGEGGDLGSTARDSPTRGPPCHNPNVGRRARMAREQRKEPGGGPEGLTAPSPDGVSRQWERRSSRSGQQGPLSLSDRGTTLLSFTTTNQQPPIVGILGRAHHRHH